MPDFMLLLYDETEMPEDLSAEDVQSMIGEYVEWRMQIAEQGKMIGGDKLTDEGGQKYFNGRRRNSGYRWPLC